MDIARFQSTYKAVTVFNAFQQAVECYGLPSIVHLDCGGENVLVGHFMLEHSESSIVVEVSTTTE